MLEIMQLEQLIAISKNRTISKAAEELNLSQPALSRSIQKLERALGVTLFERQKNRVALNPNGQLAVEYAEKIIRETHDMAEHIRAFDRSRHTIAVGSCAPAPLWDIVLKQDGWPQNRVIIPISDEAAHVIYYYVSRVEEKKKLSKFFARLNAVAT